MKDKTSLYGWLAVLCAGILRLYGLSWRALNVDEASTILASSSVPFCRLLSEGLPKLTYPPLLYLIFYPFGWGESSVWIYRAIPVISGIVSVWLVLKIGSLLFGPSIGVLSSFIFAFFPAHVFYSQSISPYPILIFLLLTSMYFYLKMTLTGKSPIKVIIGYLIPTALSIYLHYLAFLPLCFQNIFILYLAWRKDIRGNNLKKWAFVQGILFVLLLPVLGLFVLQLISTFGVSWVSYHLRFMRFTLLFPVYLILTYGFPSDEIFPWLDRFYDFDTPYIPLRSLAGSSPTIAITTLFFLFLLGFGMAFPSQGRDIVKKKFVIGYLLFPIVSLYIASYFKLLFYPRYLLIILPAYAMVLSMGALNIKNRGMRRAVIVILCATLLGFNIRQYNCSGGENYRDTADFVVQNYRARDIVALSYYYVQPAFIFYLQGRPIPLFAFENVYKPETNLNETITGIEKQAHDLSLHYKRLWLVPSFNPLWYKRYLMAEELGSKFPILAATSPTGIKPGYILYDLKKRISRQ